MMRATSLSGVLGAQVMTPTVMESATVAEARATGASESMATLCMGPSLPPSSTWQSAMTRNWPVVNYSPPKLGVVLSRPTEPSISAPDRLRVLVETGIALSSELSLPALLEQLIETAAQLTGARYGALGVIDRLGHRARAVHHRRGRRGDAGGDRRPAPRARDPRRPDPRPASRSG